MGILILFVSYRAVISKKAKNKKTMSVDNFSASFFRRVSRHHRQDFEQKRRRRRNVVEESANVGDFVDRRRRKQVALESRQELGRRLEEGVVVVADPVGQSRRPFGSAKVARPVNKIDMKTPIPGKCDACGIT